MARTIEEIRQEIRLNRNDLRQAKQVMRCADEDVQRIEHKINQLATELMELHYAKEEPKQ